jgi:hypothetical protein
MRMFLAVTACATVTVMAGAQPSRADVSYPWCAEYSMQGSSNCGFISYQQCMAALSGNGGYCTANPMFRPGPSALAPRR